MSNYRHYLGRGIKKLRGAKAQRHDYIGENQIKTFKDLIEAWYKYEV